MEPSHDVSMILCLPSILVRLALQSLSGLSPVSLLKWPLIIWYDMMMSPGVNERPFILFSSSTRLASRCARHGELSFLPQWVSATSALRGQATLTRLASKYARHGELCLPCPRHGAWEASNYAFLPLLAFATRHCELEASNFNFLPQLAFELAVAS